jgi:hypothetical protein
MKFSRKWLYSAMTVPVLGAASLGWWQHSRPAKADAVAPAPVAPGLVAVSIKPGEPVNRIEHLTCEVSQGWPVILVRDANESSPWWVQGQAERQEAHKFTARAHFGNETTESGQRYQIVVLQAAEESAARRFETGTVLDEIPSDLPRSEFIEVVHR